MKVELKKIALYVIISALISAVFMAFAGLMAGWFPPFWLWATAYGILLAYTLFKGWHHLLWKDMVTHEPISEKEIDNMF